MNPYMEDIPLSDYSSSLKTPTMMTEASDPSLEETMNIYPMSPCELSSFDELIGEDPTNNVDFAEYHHPLDILNMLELTLFDEPSTELSNEPSKDPSDDPSGEPSLETDVDDPSELDTQEYIRPDRDDPSELDTQEYVRPKKKTVCFNNRLDFFKEPPHLKTILNEYRKDTYIQRKSDKARMERILSKIFTSEHRDKIWKRNNTHIL